MRRLNFYRSLSFLWMIGSCAAFADPLRGALDVGASTALSYEARNVFVNPAALGFETVLDGANFSSSFSLASNPGLGAEDLAFALAYGYLGFGIERLAPGGISRYQFALGVPLSSRVFFGARYGLHRYDSGLRMDVWDLGAQFRFHPKFALSLLVNQVNQPLLGGTQVPLIGTLGVALRPLRSVELCWDVSSDSTAFLRRFDHQAVLGWSPVEGAQLRIGYHSQYQWLLGLRFHFGNGSVFGSVQPSSQSRRVMVGLQSSLMPHSTRLFPPKTVKVNLNGLLSDEKVSGGLLSTARPSLLDLLQDFQEIERDSTVRTVLIHLEGFPLGLASAEEVHRSILRLRSSGKSVQVFLGNAGIKEYLIASAGSEIFLEPAGQIQWLGVRAERYFLKGTLEKIGVEGEFLAAGKYKSAPEMFTRKTSSEPSRTATEEELKAAEETLQHLLSKSRGVTPERWKKLLALGLLSSDEAKAEKLIDGIASFQATLAERKKTGWVQTVIPKRRDTWALPDRVSVIVASGNILPNRLRCLSLGGDGQVTPNGMTKKLQAVEQDPRTGAVVLRVSSPGGEVLASQQIASQLETLRLSKPLLVSMGDVAASGGYYISAPAVHIFANPLTLTGSIGVYLGKFNFTGLYRFLDLHKEVLSSAPYPGLFTEHRAWTKPEQAVMERRLWNYYESFLAYVSKWRGLSKPAVEEAARGRVWLGKKALEHHLVDELGGYHETIQKAVSHGGMDPQNYEVVEVELGSGLLGLFSDSDWALSRKPFTPLSVLISPQIEQDLLWIALAQEQPFWFLSLSAPPDA